MPGSGAKRRFPTVTNVFVRAVLVNGSSSQKWSAFGQIIVQTALVYYSFKSLFAMLWNANNEVGESVAGLSGLVEQRAAMGALLALKLKTTRRAFDDGLAEFIVSERDRVGLGRWFTGRLTPAEVREVLVRLETDGKLTSISDADEADDTDTFKSCLMSPMSECGRNRRLFCRRCTSARASTQANV